MGDFTGQVSVDGICKQVTDDPTSASLMAADGFHYGHMDGTYTIEMGDTTVNGQVVSSGGTTQAFMDGTLTK